jgi:hypothetical protein
MTPERAAGYTMGMTVFRYLCLFACNSGIKENAGNRIFRSVPARGPTPRLDPRKYYRGATFPDITGNQKPNGKGITAHGPQHYTSC